MGLQEGALSKWWRTSRWGARTVALLGVGGGVLIVLSLVPSPGPDAAWLRDFLMTVGASLVLFAPFYLLTRSLDRHLDRVATDTAQQVAEVRTESAAKVEALRVDVNRRLEDVARSVSERLAAETATDRSTFQALRSSAPSREGLTEALTRALGLGLISDRRRPRVRVTSANHYCVSVGLVSNGWDDGDPQFRVESSDGRIEAEISWVSAEGVDEVLVKVGRAIFRLSQEEFNPALLFAGLADLLDVALSHPERRPAVELFPPQWVLCDWGVANYDGNIYTVDLDAIRKSATIYEHVRDKTWVDFNSWDAAFRTAQELFPVEPPF